MEGDAVRLIVFDNPVRKSHYYLAMGQISKHPSWSIFTTQTISYLLIILVITMTFSLFFFSTARIHLEHEVGLKLQDIARITARNAPYERLELIKAGDDQTRMVLRLKEKLGEIREATGIENIFIFHPDLTSLLDLRPDKAIDTVYLLPHFKREFLVALSGNEAVSTGSYRAPSGNLFISAYAPIMDTDNRLFAIVGVDAGAREVEVIEQMRSRLYFVAGLGVVLAFGLAMLLARRLTRPIRGMAETAERIGRGDYQQRVTLPSITELRVLADSINTMANQVQSRDAKLKEMSASVAHEIRNPLNSIKLLITLLEEELQENERAVHLKTIDTLHYEIGKLNRFLTEYLTYSRPITLARDEVAPAALAQGAMDMAAAEAAAKQLNISLVSVPDLSYIFVDRQRMEQSLLNIILNAIQSCPEQGNVTVEVRRTPDTNGVEFIVEDSGPGISRDCFGRLFEPFFTTKESGTGLGLSNSRKIVNSHGGEIFAENIPGRGARFVVRLPITQTGSKEECDG